MFVADSYFGQSAENWTALVGVCSDSSQTWLNTIRNSVLPCSLKLRMVLSKTKRRLPVELNASSPLLFVGLPNTQLHIQYCNNNVRCLHTLRRVFNVIACINA